jgi:predicted acetyltransferase
VIELVRPAAGGHREWLDFVAEFEGAHIDGASVADEAIAGLADPATFESWIRTLADQERGRNLPEGRVPSTSRWIARDGALVGTIDLRHRLNDFLLHQGGHIGYAVRPAARRQGIAGEALRLMLGQARELGIDPVLVCCNEQNVPSRRIIEAAGGSYEDTREGVRRYWICVSGVRASRA